MCAAVKLPKDCYKCALGGAAATDGGAVTQHKNLNSWIVRTSHFANNNLLHKEASRRLYTLCCLCLLASLFSLQEARPSASLGTSHVPAARGEKTPI